MVRVSYTKQTARLDARKPQDIARAAHLLRTGGTVAFPTETVYGLGANALDPAAVEQIFVAKQRPHWDPLIVHIAAREQLSQIARTTPEVDGLLTRFWPGPLTLLLPRTVAVPDIVTAGRELVGVRQPQHPVALELLRQAAVPVAAPSANTFSHTSPTTAQHVLDDLDGRIDAVLDGGPAEVGVESTVAEVVEDDRGRHVLVYRPGAVSLAMLSFVEGLGAARLFEAGPRSLEAEDSLPSPGVGLRHYAPAAQVLLVEGSRARDRLARESWLAEAIGEAGAAGSRVGVMLPDGWDRGAAPMVYAWGPWGQDALLASRLFAGLRELEQLGATVIICPVPETAGVAEAIRDRLQKAART